MSHVVNIGLVPLGGTNPIRIQSMLNTNTLDTVSCVKQSISLIESGCEYVRITVPTLKEAESLKLIQKKLRQAGYSTPLIADVHFKPEVAEYCACFIEKVRINPGNYADKKSFKQKAYSETEYLSELDRIATRLLPLIRICKEYGTAIRIGTNHGSLSDRIINRFGDTPTGMVESTMEFLRIFNNYGFKNIVVSLKASNPLIMIEANKLLVNHMHKENLNFPLHLGVTEAGAGEDGRIKSALGIGTLLNEGIGDTIRVSLTENPVNEIPFAQKIANSFPRKNACAGITYELQSSSRNTPLVISKLNKSDIPLLHKLFVHDITKNSFSKHPSSPDGLFVKDTFGSFNFEKDIALIKKCSFIETKKENHLSINLKENAPHHIFAIDTDEASVIGDIKKTHKNIPLYVIVKKKEKDLDTWLIKKTVAFAPLLVNRIIDGFLTDVRGSNNLSLTNALFGIMQGCRVRISKTEYISCPTCGRTTFDMEAALKCIKESTSHLKGLKIGVMGCIVNGPGEMADADYGYVGNKLGYVNLYKGKTLVKKNIIQSKAIEELIDILKKDGVWKEIK